MEIQVAGVRVQVADAGRGSPVVLVHSAGGSGGQWRALGRALAGYRLLAPDLFGHGLTEPWPGDGGRPFALADEAALVAAVIDAAGEPVHLVGHSYGGSACVEAALARPERLRALVLVEPTLFAVLRAAGEDAAWREVSEVVAGVERLVAEGSPGGAARVFIEYLLGAGSWDRLADERREFMARLMGPTILGEALAQMRPEGHLDRCRALDVPALVLRGTASPLALARVSEVLAAAIPGAGIQHLEGAGHMAPLTHPALVNPAIAAFLGRL